MTAVRVAVDDFSEVPATLTRMIGEMAGIQANLATVEQGVANLPQLREEFAALRARMALLGTLALVLLPTVGAAVVWVIKAMP